MAPRTYVGRGALKLAHALTAFDIDVRERTCADFGCNVGGFTDCLLQAGAAKVYAVDTGYAMLAWRLRQDPRVVVMERTNALHATPPQDPVSVVAVDLGWTPQRHAVPAALRWLTSRSDSAPRSGEAHQDHHDRMILTLIKPHYEADEHEKALLRRGVLDESAADAIARRVLDQMPALGVRVLAAERSPIIGGAGKKSTSGNIEWLAVLAP